MGRGFLRAAFLVGVLAGSACAFAEEPASAPAPPPSTNVDPAAAAAAERINRLEEVLKTRPDDGMLQYFLAMFHAQAGHRVEALAWLRRVADRRMGFQPVPDGGFDVLWSDPDFQAIVHQMESQEPRVAGAPVAWQLPDARLLPEGIAYDATSKRFFVSSVAERKILTRGADGKFSDFSHPDDGLKSVLGLRVDEQRRLLYAVSTNSFAHAADEAQQNALFVYDLDSGKVRERHLAVEAVNLNDVALNDAGDVVLTDSGSGAIYRLDQTQHTLVQLLPPGSLAAANGIAFAPDGKHFYVGFATGIARVELDTGTAQRMAQPTDIATGVIDGLYYHDGALIGVQNVICPGRVIRVQLDAQGSAITGLRVLQAYHPLLDEPTTGAVVGDDLYLIANSFVSRMREDGSLKDEASLKPTSILRISLK